MFSPLRGKCALIVVLLLIGAGCGQPVREDRSINWEKSGQSVGFQHGKEGVFLADKDGGRLTKIFQPGEDVIATSSPLWSPDNRKVIFTTARAPAGQPHIETPNWGRDDPAGNILLEQPIVYTCWLHEPAGGNEESKPGPLFEAHCDHVGYVAANLAVRWHPKGHSIFFVKQVADGKHGVFEYDLASGEAHAAFPHDSSALIFDWSPDGSHLACVLAGRSPEDEMAGVWIRHAGRNEWWHVPRSSALARGELPSRLEHLRATRPAWTKDGTCFAFVSYTPPKTKDQKGSYFLRVGTQASRHVDDWIEVDEPIRDLHWLGNGERLAFVRGGEFPSLLIMGHDGAISKAVNQKPVRRFAGWNATGDRLAYIVPDPVSHADDEIWAFLLVADPLARDAVYVASGTGDEPGRVVFSGLRVTFPLWSPKEDKLSLWVTFNPVYRSYLSLLLGWGLRAGDPAAIFDLKTRQLEWMAVSPQEKVQIGHYYLLKRDYAKAWNWYEKAESELPAPKAVSANEFISFLRNLRQPRDFSFFQYYCLTKLGRKAEGHAKLEEFKRLFLPDLSRDASRNKEPDQDLSSGWFLDGKTLGAWLQELLDSKSLFGWLLKDLYMAEAFLSLDAALDAETFFRQSLTAAESDAARLSSAIVLGQILLIERKHRGYADLATETISPLLLKLAKPKPPEGELARMAPQLLFDIIGALSLAPMWSPDFLAEIPREQLEAMAARWQSLRTQATTNVGRQEIDLFLLASYLRLGREKNRLEVHQRLQSGTMEIPIFPANGDPGQGIKLLRQGIKELFQRTEDSLGRS